MSLRVAESNPSGYSYLPSSTFFAIGEKAVYRKSPLRLPWQIGDFSAE